MAIVLKDKSKDPLREVSKGKTLDGIKTEVKVDVSTESVSDFRKVNFLKSTIEELKQVAWPGFSQTVNWSVIVILFTVLISITIGFFDHIFASTINYIDCTSIHGRGASMTLDQCNREFADKLTFRK